LSRPGPVCLAGQRGSSSCVACSTSHRKSGAVGSRAAAVGVACACDGRAAVANRAAGSGCPRAAGLARERCGCADVANCTGHSISGSIRSAATAQGVASRGGRSAAVPNSTTRGSTPCGIRLASDRRGRAGVTCGAGRRARRFISGRARTKRVASLRRFVASHPATGTAIIFPASRAIARPADFRGTSIEAHSQIIAFIATSVLDIHCFKSH